MPETVLSFRKDYLHFKGLFPLFCVADSEIYDDSKDNDFGKWPCKPKYFIKVPDCFLKVTETRSQKLKVSPHII